MIRLFKTLCACGLLFSLSCASSDTATSGENPNGHASGTSTPQWALVLHGGAGVISKDKPAAEIAGYRAALQAALEEGQRRLAAGESSLDVVEAVVRQLENDPHFNAGKGAVFTHEGKHELDASIMDGRDLSCGAVTGVRTIKHPITLARKVMENTRHVFLMGDGAESYADLAGVERVPNSYFSTEKRRRALQRALQRDAAKASRKGTVGCVALDQQGNLAAATSTGGMTNKRWGRIGDSPVIGAGTWADNRNCAVSCTGTGEEYIRRSVARDLGALVEYKGMGLEKAARHIVFDKLNPDDGGLIAVSNTGEIAMTFNTAGMFRGAANSNGRFEIKIWE